ncbi:MAG TPA: GAP family protein [Candidatus Cybelea sp.]
MVGQTLPYALGILLQPLPVIPVLFMLLGPRPRQSSIAYAVGWCCAIAFATEIFVLISVFITNIESTPRWLPWAVIPLGIALLLLAIQRWSVRHKPQPLPGWMTALETASPAKAFGLGFLVSIVSSPVFLIGAGLTIGAASQPPAKDAYDVLSFTAIASGLVILPVDLYLIAGKSVASALLASKQWLERNYATVSTVILFAFGVLILMKGIGSL